MNRQDTLAKLADTFGRCLAENVSAGSPAVPRESKRRRLQKIARLMDRLSRRPANTSWHRRAEKIYREIAATLRANAKPPRANSLWAAAA